MKRQEYLNFGKVMAYKGRYPRTRKFVGKKRYDNYARGVGQLKKDVRMIKDTINVEKKYLDVNQDTNITNTGTVVPISLMGQGDDVSERNGRRIKAYSEFLRGQITIDPSATKTTFRYIIVRDNNPNGANISFTDVLEGGTDLQSPLKKQNAGMRFKVLCDRTVDLSINGVETKSVYFFRRLYEHVNFLGTGSTAGNLGPGAYFLMLLSNEPTAAPLFHYWNRFSYVDN